MLLDKEKIEAINFHCGDGDGDDSQFGEYSDGLLWIGAVTDDDGKEVYGLHLATAEYPEEGSTTLVEFEEPEDAAQSQLAALREELASAVKDRETLLRLHVHLRARRSYWITEEGKAQQRLADAERRNAIMREALETLNNYGFDPNSGSGSWGEIRITLEDWNLIQAALNPNPEAASHDE